MNKVLSLFISVVLCILATHCDSAKILAVFPFPSYSHQVVFRPLTQELARRGHEVTILTPDPAFTKENTPPNITEIDLHDISYEVWRSGLAKAIKEDQSSMELMSFLLPVVLDIMESQFKSPEVQKLLSEKKEFDLILVESNPQTSLIYSYIYNAPVIQISSLGLIVEQNNDLGIPVHPILYPQFMSKMPNKPTIWEKVQEFLEFFKMLRHFYGPAMSATDMTLKKSFGSKIPSLNELKKNVDLTFLNIHPIWQSNVPEPPNVVHIWGIYSKPKKELPQDMKSYLDSSKHGVIYMSFGSNAMPSALPADKIQAFVKVFSELPYDVLWKWDKDVLPGKSDNIRIGKWFPQSDILRHPKIKLFITQGGIQSAQEAIEAAVPLIGVPIFGDQYYNVEKYRQFQIGERLDINTLTEKDVRDTVNKVLGDKKYRKNVIKLRDVMRDEPQSALERAVWWTEYVLRHKGAKHLRAAGANLSWTEYYEIPLVSFVVIGFLSLILIIVILARKIINFIMPSSKFKQN